MTPLVSDRSRRRLMRVTSLVCLATAVSFIGTAGYFTLLVGRADLLHAGTGVAFLALGWLIDLDLRFRTSIGLAAQALRDADAALRTMDTTMRAMAASSHEPCACDPRRADGRA